MKKQLKSCPECGSETVVVNENVGNYKVVREECTGLTAEHNDQPLSACTWSQELNSEPIVFPGSGAPANNQHQP